MIAFLFSVFMYPLIAIYQLLGVRIGYSDCDWHTVLPTSAEVLNPLVGRLSVQGTYEEK